MPSIDTTTPAVSEDFDRNLCRLSIEASRLAVAADELLLNASGFEQELAAQIARIERQINWFRCRGLAHSIDWYKEQLNAEKNN
ncbi:hypothetical protein NLN82_23335 [Citrobacter portucalensis]|uniref:hypothetical protein n=1 Tax=Citrobacter portucalensis TaxID=1639133 RepID=UPI00226BA597|nr:hypothetical protein [Citrobacter portucalensis]MCX9038962.1 hypothetical protein [Citrobacter portucalensis]